MTITSLINVPLFLTMIFTILFSMRAGADEAGGTGGDLMSPYYVVEDGKVDARTFMGWRVFHMNCHSCHGLDAIGSDIAPNLVEKLKTMGPDTFAITVLKRYRIALGMSQATAETESMARNMIVEEMRKQQRGREGELIMPGWEEFNPGIRAHILDLYAYLKARSDGVLRPGRPELIK